MQFLDGNIDHPIVIGVVYNSAHPPPWQLPQQRALSGLRSRELGARGANHLVLDDTMSAIQAQLRSAIQDTVRPFRPAHHRHTFRTWHGRSEWL